MKYIIQLFKPTNEDATTVGEWVGYWRDTNWGGDDHDKVVNYPYPKEVQ